MLARRLLNRLLFALSIASLLLAGCGPATPTDTPPPTATTAIISAPTATPEPPDTPPTLPATESPTGAPTAEAPASPKLVFARFESAGR